MCRSTASLNSNAGQINSEVQVLLLYQHVHVSVVYLLVIILVSVRTIYHFAHHILKMSARRKFLDRVKKELSSAQRKSRSAFIIEWKDSLAQSSLS